MTKRILIVDDNQELATLLAFALQRRGYLVEPAANGADALERLRHTQFDVVLLDWTMPVMDGPTFLRELRRAAGTSVPPVVVLSGAPEAVLLAPAVGAAAVVVKPFRFEGLQALLERLIGPPEP